MKYTYLLTIALFLFITKLSAQDFPLWNKTSDDDLKMTIFTEDSTAAAVVLVNYGETRFAIFSNTQCYIYDYHYQIKILNKSAFDEANIKLNFGLSDNPFKAETRNLPIELPYLFTEQFIVNLSIPEGYVLDELPKNSLVKLPNNAGILVKG